MSRIQQCAGIPRLRLSPDGTRLCLCGPTAECCRSHESLDGPGGTHHVCGRSDSFRKFCITDYAESRTTTRTTTGAYNSRFEGTLTPGMLAWYLEQLQREGTRPDQVCLDASTGAVVYELASNTDMRSVVTQETTLHEPSSIGTRSCSATWRAPCLVRYNNRLDVTGSTTQTPPCTIPPTSNTYSEEQNDLYIDCLPFSGTCWPLNGQYASNRASPAGGNQIDFSLLLPGGAVIVAGPPQVTVRGYTVPGGATIAQETVTITTEVEYRWNGEDTTWFEEYQRTVTTRIDRVYSGQTVTAIIGGADGGSALVTFSGSNTIIDVEVYRANLRLAASWQTACDGTAGPNNCIIVPTECVPDPLPYIVGEPCTGFAVPPPPVVVPRENVRTCGYLRIGAWCYKFRPDGPKTYDPQAMGATISTEVISATLSNYMPTCCACLDSCGRTDLRQNAPPCWLNATYNASTGRLDTSPAFVAGECCCLPGDIIRWDRYRFTSETWDANEQAYVFGEEITNSPSPGDIPGAANMHAGVRRDYVGPTQINERLRTMNRGVPNSDYLLNTWFLGQFNYQCEWRGLLSSGGGGDITQFSFAEPQSGSVFQQAPLRCPADADILPDGSYEVFGPTRRIRIRRYSVAVTCDGYAANGEWELFDQFGGPGSPEFPVQRWTIDVYWSITRTPPSPGEICTGGCPPPPNLTPVGPDVPIGPDAIPDVTSILGGI